jgi:MscS family membrane protein
MNSFLDQTFLDNPLRVYLIVAGILLFAVLFKRFFSKYLASLLFRMVKRVARGVDRTPFINLVAQPMEIFLLILITMVALEKLKWPSALQFEIYKISFHSIVESISIIVLVISFIWLLRRIIDFIAMLLEQKANLTPEQTDNQLIIFFRDFFKAVLALIGVLMALKFGFNFPIGSLVTGLSIATAAIALATRESLENLIASFIIFFDKPFTVGDQVKVQQVTGIVEKIGLRSTRVRTTEKTWVTVPNKQMVDSILDNLTLRTQRRGFINLELRSQTSHEDVNKFLSEAEALLRSRGKELDSFTVLLTDITKDAFIVQIEYFIAAVPQEAFNFSRQQIALSVIQLLEQMNIKLASKETEIIINREG